MPAAPPERASESTLTELIEVDPAVAVLWVEDGLAPDPDEMELPVDELEPIDPDNVGEPLDPPTDDPLTDDPLVGDPLPMDEPPLEPLLPVESWANADDGTRPVAAISSVKAPNFVERFMVMAVNPIFLVNSPRSREMMQRSPDLPIDPDLGRHSANNSEATSASV